MSSVSSINSLLSSATSTASSGTDISSLLAAATGATSPGIDVTAAVNAAIYAAQAPERQWQAQQATLQSQITAVGSVQTALAAVNKDLDSLNDLGGVLASQVISSSNPGMVTGSVTSGAISGSHVITVAALATKASWYSTPVSGQNSSLGNSTITVMKNDGTQASFTLGGSGTSSLSALANDINVAGLGVTASVVNDASGSRLALVSNSTGASAGFTVFDGSASGNTVASASVASVSTALDASSFVVADGTSSATINVAKGSSLSDIANQINSQGLTLTASVVTDTSGAHLQLSATGSNTVSMSRDPVLTLTQASAAQNASLTLDGVPVSSTSNTVTGAIPGVTLALQGASPGTSSTVTIAADTTQIVSAINQYVTDYNSAVTLVNSQFQYSTTNQSEGTLGTDSTVRSLQSALEGLATYKSTSAPASASSSISTLASLGIAMNNDGTLSINSDTLQQAVQNNPSGVQRFFQGSSLNGFAKAASTALNSFTNPANGSLSLDAKNLTAQYNALQTEVNDYENGSIASQRTVLTDMYSKAEIALQQLPTTIKQLQAQLGQNSGG